MTASHSLASLVLAAVSLASCVAEPAPSHENVRRATKADLAGRKLVSVTVTEAGQPVQLVPSFARPDKQPHFYVAFWNPAIGATGGCNGDTATSWSAVGGILSVHDMGGTLIGCDATADRQDHWVADLIAASPQVWISESGIIIEGGDKVLTMVDGPWFFDP